AVGFGPSISVELPGVADFLDEIEIEVRDDQFVLVATRLRDQAAARVAEVALPVEFADVPRRLGADAVDGADEIAVRHRVRRLLELPEILGEPGHRRRRVEDDLRAVEAENPRAFRKVAVVADVDADLADRRLKHRVPGIPGAEVVLLPEARRDLRDVVL